MNGFTVVLLFGTFICVSITSIRGTTLSDSACYGTNPDCDYYTLSCNSSEHAIRLQDLYVGFKAQNICMQSSHCNNSETCCNQAPDDVTELFNLKNTFDAYNNCSGKSECTNVQAPWQLTGSTVPSTYVYMEYTCVQETTILNFCGSPLDGSPVSMTSNSVEMKFDSRRQNKSSATDPMDCKCTVTSTDGTSINITMELIDIRLHSYRTIGNQSQQYMCSTSQFTSEVYNDTCVNSTNHATDNFRYNETFVWEVVTQSEIFLTDVYTLGDSPAMVWVSVTGDSSRDISVTCNEVLAQMSTITSTSPDMPSSTAPSSSTSPSTFSSTMTSTDETTSYASAQTGKDDDRTTLYLAVFIPIGCLVIILSIMIIIWRCGQQRKANRRLKYLSKSHSSRTNHDSLILDRFIYDITKLDVSAGSPAVIGDEKETNGDLRTNPVNEPVTEPTPIKTISDSVKPTYLTSNNLSVLMKTSQFSDPDRNSNTARISIPTDADNKLLNEHSTSNGRINTQYPNLEPGLSSVYVAASTNKPEQSQETMKGYRESAAPSGIQQLSKTNKSGNPQTQNNPETNNKNHYTGPPNLRTSPSNPQTSTSKPQTNNPQTRENKAKESVHSRLRIEETKDGGVVIHIGATEPKSQNTSNNAVVRDEPSNGPAMIVPETTEERRSGTAHILPGLSKKDGTSVLFVSKPVTRAT